MISACMIVRNEARWIGGAIASAREAADEVVVVDTGSTDETREIAETAGARVERFAWCDDFSAARNASIDAARGDWVLIVDADHRLAEGAAAIIRAAAKAGAHDAYRLPTHEAMDESDATADVVSGKRRRGLPWHPTALMRRQIGGERVRYENPVHEDPLPWIVAHSTRDVPALDRADVVHYGGCKTTRAARGSDVRNRTMLQRWLESEPWNLTPYHYLAQDAFASGDSAKTAAIISTALSQPARKSEASKILSLAILGAMCSIDLDENDRAATFLRVANERANEAHPDVRFLEGTLAEQVGSYEKAIVHYTRALSLAGQRWSYVALAGATSWASAHRIAACYLALGRPDDALDYVDRALACEGDGYEGAAREESVRLREAIVQEKGAA